MNKFIKTSATLLLIGLSTIACSSSVIAEDSKQTEFVETVESGYEWSIPSSVSVADGGFTINVEKNIIPADKKLVISTASNKITLASDEGATLTLTLDATSYELAAGEVGSKRINISTDTAKVAGTYKGTSTFTATVVNK